MDLVHAILSWYLRTVQPPAPVAARTAVCVLKDECLVSLQGVTGPVAACSNVC